MASWTAATGAATVQADFNAFTCTAGNANGQWGWENGYATPANAPHAKSRNDEQNAATQRLHGGKMNACQKQSAVGVLEEQQARDFQAVDKGVWHSKGPA